MATLPAEYPPQSYASMKRGRDEGQPSPLEEGSPKRTQLFGDVTLGSITPFL